jgi:hypothetical protein
MTLKNRIKKIAELLRKFNEKNELGIENYARIRTVDVSEIDGFDNYPADFQLFISEIGYLDLATNDYAALCVDKPLLLSEVLSNKDLRQDDIRLLEFCMADRRPELQLIDELTGQLPDAAVRYPDRFVVVAAWPCSYEVMGFDLTVSPYRPLNYFGEFFPKWGETFLDFVEYEINWNPSFTNL